eukprot:TRINITY_DN31935_c0_g1_i1.p1 TRINITY_DN31935_c0_g1~~TRINITY_DN31935_c0_g1_i1.p1  ORF type:complete len:385 (-),score=64.37 TRINITY_DN31935_c0_g1_i1:121-1275(-)
MATGRLSISDTKAELVRLGIDFSGCVERAELEDLLRKASGSKPKAQLCLLPNPNHGVLLRAVKSTLAQQGIDVSLTDGRDRSAPPLAIEDAVRCIGNLALCDDSARERATQYQLSALPPPPPPASLVLAKPSVVLAKPSALQVGTDANTPLLAYRMNVALALGDMASESELQDAYYGSEGCNRIFQQLELHMAMFDEMWDYDFSCSPFTDPCYQDGSHTRGGLPYRRPLGWKRFALDVEDKFERPAAWLGHQDQEGEWAVAYHGTSAFAVQSIARDGIRAGGTGGVRQQHGALYGPGIYCAPHPECAAFFANTVPVEEEGSAHYFQVVFQCRVRPGSFQRHKDSLGEFWVVKSEADVRPYGLLLGECDANGEPLLQVRCDADEW